LKSFIVRSNTFSQGQWREIEASASLLPPRRAEKARLRRRASHLPQFDAIGFWIELLWHERSCFLLDVRNRLRAVFLLGATDAREVRLDPSMTKDKILLCCSRREACLTSAWPANLWGHMYPP
jgi:hypothetical protein